MTGGGDTTVGSARCRTGTGVDLLRCGASMTGGGDTTVRSGGGSTGGGAAIGGGLAIGAACDLRIVSPRATFGVPIARTLGNCLSMANLVRLASLIGSARVKELIFTARLIDAAEARAIGLVHEVVADEAALLPRAEELALRLATHAPLTLRATKEGLRRMRLRLLLPEDGRDLVLSCYLSRDFREGVKAFLAKRKPEWTGE
jgi:enoyl-CoA hydratase/carnithine racemase